MLCLCAPPRGLGGILGLGMAVCTEGSGMLALGTDLTLRLGYHG